LTSCCDDPRKSAHTAVVPARNARAITKDEDAQDPATVCTRARSLMNAPYASAALRDRFLGALDADDRALSTELATGLTTCMNPLPGMTCDQLGLPIGSTYGCAARRILLMYSTPR
jgi:hypothetical protein